MKTIIAGSREGFGYLDIFNAMKRIDWKVTEVVSGTARGVDTLGERWAEDYKIPAKRFPADWEKYGRSAGFIRNMKMAEYADAAVIFWDGKSPGTKNMISNAEKFGLVYKVIRKHS